MLIPSLSLVCNSPRLAPIKNFYYFSTALVIGYNFLFYTDNNTLVELQILPDIQQDHKVMQ